MKCGAVFYRSLPYFYALICILELIASIVLVITLTVGWKVFNRNAMTTSTTTTTPIPLPPDVLAKVIIAYSIGFAGSIVPIFTGMVLFFSVMFACCICLWKKNYRRPFLRFISLNCNCPCYIPRPKLRFTIRIGFHLICIPLRIAAIIMYRLLFDEAPTGRNALQTLLTISSVCLVFPLVTILLDLYHYRIWWTYQPDIDISKDINRKPFSRKHKRFIPYVLTEPFRTAALGNRKCKYGNGCRGRELEHVVIFHSSDYQPQPRWSNEYPIYIGFHRTTPQAAFSIAKSEFVPSKKGMLGPGAYFARSTEATLSKIGKADQTGAWFVAEISMGKVFLVDDYSIRKFPNNKRFNADLERFIRNGDWSAQYDTCYFKHYIDSRDEFCIKDPAKQILRWVIVIETPYDRKISLYGLDYELNSAAFGCC
jgi:hypothetical protein